MHQKNEQKIDFLFIVSPRGSKFSAAYIHENPEHSRDVQPHFDGLLGLEKSLPENAAIWLNLDCAVNYETESPEWLTPKTTLGWPAKFSHRACLAGMYTRFRPPPDL
jgi:hypothetical protein